MGLSDFSDYLRKGEGSFNTLYHCIKNYFLVHPRVTFENGIALTSILKLILSFYKLYSVFQTIKFSINNWEVQLVHTGQNFPPNLRFRPHYSLVRGLVQLYHWWRINVVMTKEPYVVNNLLLFTVLSYDVTVDNGGMIAWGWFTTATWWRWIESLWVGSGDGHQSYRVVQCQ